MDGLRRSLKTANQAKRSTAAEDPFDNKTPLKTGVSSNVVNNPSPPVKKKEVEEISPGMSNKKRYREHNAEHQIVIDEKYML